MAYQVRKRLPLYQEAFYSYNATLGDDSFSFSFHYSDRAKAYLMDIQDAEGKSVIKGVKLVTGTLLLKQYSLESISGDLLLIPKQELPVYEWDVPEGRKVYQTHALVYLVETDNGEQQ